MATQTATTQQAYVMNNKVRPAADRLGKTYNYFKALQAEYTAQGWSTLFGSTGTTLDDGSVSDGRPLITDTDITNFFAIVGTFITYMEATSFANRNLTVKIGPNSDQV